MIPKLASNLLHFNVQRVAAAVQTQTTQTLRNVLQFQPQAQAQSVAPSTSATATSLGWNSANGAAGTGAGPGGAKFNAGGRFYNAFQVSPLPRSDRQIIVPNIPHFRHFPPPPTLLPRPM